MAAASRDSVPESRWGWMAVPDVGKEGTDGTQVVMRRSLSSRFRLYPLFSSFLSSS